MSVADVLCPDHQFRTGCNQPKSPGDRVMIGNNRGPVYVIIYATDRDAWIHNESEGHIVPLELLRRIEGR